MNTDDTPSPETTPLAPGITEVLRGHVESADTDAAFERAWAGANARSGSSRLATLALVAAAVLVIAVPAWRIAGPALFDASGSAQGGGMAATPEIPWEEPYTLRFPVDAPVPEAREAVREAMLARSPDSEAWKQALALTPVAERGRIHLRRALVAMQAEDFDAIREHGLASGLPAGQLLAAEVHIVDLEFDAAVPLLRELEKRDDAIGRLARTYRTLNDESPIAQGLAEIGAMANLGGTSIACSHAREIVPDLTPVLLRRLETELPILLQCAKASSPGDATPPTPVRASMPVHITTVPPDATLRIDGEIAGRTPWRLPVTVGEHRYRLEMPGYLPVEGALVVAPGEPLHVQHALVAADAEPGRSRSAAPAASGAR